MAEISAKQQRAIELKYDSQSYQTIAKTLHVSVDTIKNWFASDGVLFDRYNQYAKEMNRVSILEASSTIAQNVWIASRVLVALMGSNRDEIKFKAAREILSFALNKETSIAKYDEQEDDVDKWDFEDRLKLYEEWKEKENEVTSEYLETLEKAIRAAVPDYADHQGLQKALGDVRRRALRP